MGMNYISIVETEGENRVEAKQQAQDGSDTKIDYRNSKMSWVQTFFHILCMEIATPD